MKKYFVYLTVLALFTVVISAIDMEKECNVRKTGWPLPDFEKYKKAECKKLKIENIPEEFVIQYYDLKEKYKSELYQFEMNITPTKELGKFTLKSFGIIKLIKDKNEIVMAYDYHSLFYIGVLVSNKYQSYTGGAAIPIILIDQDGDGKYEKQFSSLVQDKEGYFIDMQKEVTKYMYKKMMEKKGLKKSKKDGC